MYICIADVSHFQKMSEEQSQEFDFQWNSQPDAIGVNLYIFKSLNSWQDFFL